MFVWPVIVCVLLVGLWLATPDAANAKETVAIDIRDDIASLDPHKSYGGTALGHYEYVYERLVNFQNNDFTQPVPELAESWKLGEDGRILTFHLRKDVYFPGGTPLNAEAVVFSLHRALKLEHPPF